MPQITPTSVNRTQPRRLNAPLLPTPATCNDHAGPRPIPLRLPSGSPFLSPLRFRLLSPSASASFAPPLPPPLPLRPMLVNVHLLDEPKVTTRLPNERYAGRCDGGWLGRPRWTHAKAVRSPGGGTRFPRPRTTRARGRGPDP